MGSLADAVRVPGWYGDRRVVEEFHRAETEGRRLGATQPDDAADVARLAAVVAAVAVAVRLPQLRDAARRARDDPRQGTRPKPRGRRRPERGSASWPAPPAWPRGDLTPTLSYRTIAGRGGHLGRTRDGPPGWKTLWRGRHDVSLLVAGAELAPRDETGTRSG